MLEKTFNFLWLLTQFLVWTVYLGIEWLVERYGWRNKNG